MLNALLKEERAIVSEIVGTTRDTIEDKIVLGGIAFRFIDTAGIRDTTDEIEANGVKKSHEKISEASLVLFLFDLDTESIESVEEKINQLNQKDTPYIAIGNKADKVGGAIIKAFEKLPNTISITATHHDDLVRLEDAILEKVNIDTFTTGDTVITNIGH